MKLSAWSVGLPNVTESVFGVQIRKKYGNIYSLYLGSKPMVMLCGVQAIKEALVNKGVEFAGRPQDLYVNITTENKGT